MKKLNMLSLIVIIGLSFISFSGCSSDSDSTPYVPAYSAEGVLVDPYIVGAIMCEDKNKNTTCDSDEQVSTASDANGVYKFTQALTVGSNIIIKTQGKHEGVTYDVKLSSVVTQSSSAGVTSPLTTLNARGLTTTQIADILNKAATSLSGSFSVTSTDILSDPLVGGLMDKKVSEISSTDLVKIQASLATYALLKIMNGSAILSSLSDDDLYASGMNTDGTGAVATIATQVLATIVSTLNTTTLTTIKTGINGAKTTIATAMVGTGFVSQAQADAKANAGMPEPTIGLVIKVAVTIIDKLSSVGYNKCNSSGGNYTEALGDVQTYATNYITHSNVMALGSQLYGIANHDAMKASFSGAYASVLSGVFGADANIQAGYDAKEAGKVTFRFNKQNTTVAQ